MADGAQKRYEGFDGFLREAIREYYQRSFRNHKATFVALLISSGQVMSLVKDRFSGGATPDNMKKAAFGAGLVVALRIGLGFALSGPLGILLTAGTGASLLVWAARNQDAIVAKHARVKTLTSEARRRYEELQGNYAGNRMDGPQRDLMIDGLLMRLMSDLDGV